VIAGLEKTKHYERCYALLQLRRDASRVIPIGNSGVDDSDVDSFNVQHQFLNADFSIAFDFNGLAAKRVRLVPA
jgi:hypothetical protein